MVKYYPNRTSMSKAVKQAYKRGNYVTVLPGAITASKTKSKSKKYKTKNKKYKIGYPLFGDNYLVKKVRVHRVLAYNMLKDVTDGGKRFEIYFAPWQNVEANPPATNPPPAGHTFGRANLFYSEDFAKMFASQREYNMFRLKSVYMEIRKPKVLIDYRNGGAIVSEFHDQLNLPWGTEILHTKDEIVADTTTGVLQPTLNDIKWGRTIAAPSTWKEAVDDGSRFKISTGVVQKRCWKPSTPAEKKWRFTNPGVELEHSTGGITIMMRDSQPIPNVEGPAYQPFQNIFEITATVYMEFKTKI